MTSLRFNQQIELEKNRHKFIYDPNSMTLTVDGVKISIEEYYRDGAGPLVGFNCPYAKSERNCRHIRRAKRDFFPYLAKQAFRWYDSQPVGTLLRMKSAMGSLEMRIALVPFLKLCAIKIRQGKNDKFRF